MTARRHHYLPQCYLRGFSQPRKGGKTFQVVVYDRSGKSFTANVKDIAVERDFNRIDIEGKAPDFVETTLAVFESALARALVRISASQSLQSAEDREILLTLVGLTSARNPRLRNTLGDVEDWMFKSGLEMALSTKERWESLEKRARESSEAAGEPELPKVDYETMRDFVKRGEFTVSMPHEHRIAAEFHSLETVLPLLLGRRWLVLRAPKHSAGFITCDHPAALYFTNRELRNGLYAPGLGMKGTELVFPVSRTLAIVGAFELEEGIRDLDEEGVSGVNGAVVAFAERQVFARDPNPIYSRNYGEKPRRVAELPNDTIFVRS